MTITVEDTDIRAAVAAGYLTEAQAANLLGLAAARQTSAGGRRMDDEPFQLFRGFNEVFITVGLLMFAGGFASAAWAAGLDLTVSLAVLGVLVWLGAEYLVRRRRMTLPGIVLASLFVAACARAVFDHFFSPVSLDAWPLVYALAGGLLAGVLFYWRFRLPFTLFLIGLMALAASLIAAGTIDPEQLQTTLRERPLAILDISVGSVFAWIILGLGVVGFALAMHFDMADPHRLSRQSACGFWLHLLAGPALVNTLALALLNQHSGLAYAGLLLLIALVVAVSLAIDRRSFMLSAIGYMTALITNVLFEQHSDMSVGVPLIVLCLGLLIVGLGAGWTAARGFLMRRLPGGAWKKRMPPYPGEA